MIRAKQCMNERNRRGRDNQNNEFRSHTTLQRQHQPMADFDLMFCVYTKLGSGPPSFVVPAGSHLWRQSHELPLVSFG